MRLNRNHLATILKSSKTLLMLGCGSLLTLAPLDRASAQDPASGGTAPADAPTTAGSANSADSSDSTDANAPAATPVQLLPPDTNPADTSRAIVPGVSQNPANPTPTNIPVFPAQLGNPVSPYTSSSSNPQSPQLTQPNLYVTGNRDISQISTSNALSQAFSQQNNDLTAGDAGMNYEHPPIERLRLGPFDLKAAVVANATYDDNLRTNENATSGGKKSDLEYGVTPAILLEYGDHEGQKGFASLIYSPNISRYYHESNQNNIGQNVALNAVYPLQRLTLNATQTFTQTTGVNQDSNVQTTQESTSSGIGANYEVDDKISLATQLQYVTSTFSNPGGDQNGGGNGGQSSGQGDTTATINTTATYRLSDKLTFGPSVNIGWDRPDDSAKSTYEQITGGANYTPTEKIGMFAQGGLELRQYDQGGGNTADPIFAVGIGYNPFDSTTVALNAVQAVRTSTAPIGQPTGGQTVVSTGIGVNVTQRIVQRVFVGFAFGYAHDDYSNGGGNAVAGATNGNNSEDTFTYRPTVSFNPTAWTSISIYYQYLSNESGMQGESYNDNQLGMTVSAQF